MNVIFMGTPEFALPTLESLYLNHNILAVVTQPDRPKGRGRKTIPSPVKEKALMLGLTVLQPENCKDQGFIEDLRKYTPEVIVVVAYGQILPEGILNMPKYGCINIHGSLLPKYRGAAPIQWAIINGETQTGITTMYMSKGLDCGDIIIKNEMQIEENDTYATLKEKMAHIGADTLNTTLYMLEKDLIIAAHQDDSQATYAPMITKETERIDWSKGSNEIENLIRGLSPEPGAYTLYNGEKLKLWDVSVIHDAFDGAEYGEIVDVAKKYFVVKTGNGALQINEIQSRGGKRMAVDAYLRGHAVEKGIILC